MGFRAALLSICALLSVTAARSAAQCGPKLEKQLADVRSSWVKNWNEKQIDDLVKLYYPHADVLPADGSRASGQYEIRASFQKQIGSKVEVRSLAVACSEGFAYDNGMYTQTAQTKDGQSVEGNYLVVLFWKDDKWLIVQHASTAKRRLN
jgi:uncharacterized protein (TIGR02246 family)